MIIWLACSILLGLLVDVNFIWINVIHYVLLFYCSYAIYKLFVYFGDGPLCAIAIAYAISTMLFFHICWELYKRCDSRSVGQWCQRSIGVCQ